MEFNPLILVVDDDPDILFATVRILRKANYRVIEAGTGFEALDLIRENTPELVLLDVDLPDIIGYEVCEQVKKDPTLSGTYVVMVSASKVSSDSQITGFSYGADDYITRPFVTEEFLARMQAIVRLIRTEKALRESEQTAKALLNATIDIALMIRADGTILMANHSFARFFDKNVDEIIGANVYHLFPPDLAEKRQKIAQKVIQSGLPEYYEETDYHSGYVSFNSVYPVINRRGQVDRIAVFAQDITAVRQNEAALRESEQKYRAIFEQAAVGVCQSALDGRFIRVNSKFCQLVGYPEAEMLKMNFREITHPDDLNLDIGHVEDLLADKFDSYTIEKRYIHKLDQVIWVNLAVTLVRNQTGQPAFFIGVAHDITDQKNMAQTRRQDELRASALLSLTQLPLHISEKELIDQALEAAVKLTDSEIGYLHFVNQDQKTIHLYTWNKKALEDCTVIPLTHYPIESAGLWADCLRLKRPVIHNDYQHIPDRQGYPEGHSHLIRHVSVPVFDGEQVFIVAGVGNKQTHYRDEDIRQLSQFLRSLWDIIIRRRAESLLQGISNSALSGVMVFISVRNEQNQIIDFEWKFINPAAEGLVGRLNQELIGKRLLQEMPGNRVDGLFDRYIKVVETGQPIQFEHRYHHENVKKWFLISAVPLGDGFVVTFNDITSEKNNEQQVRESNRRYALATSSAQIGVWALDIRTEELFWDDIMFDIYGQRQEDFGGTYLSWKSQVHPNDLAATVREVEMATVTGNELYVEFRIIRPNGAIRYIKANAVVDRDENGQAIRMVGTNQDITELKEAEAGLVEAKNEAERANKAKSNFLANMSHEIRTPLNAVLGYAQIIQNNPELPKEVREQSQVIIRSGNHLLDLINDILDISKIEAGKFELDQYDFNFPSFLNSVVEIFKFRAKEKNLQFVFNHTTEMPSNVRGDEKRIRQILMNLLGNAFKFTEAGQVTFHVGCLEWSDEAPRVKVRFIIEDSGYGIESADLERIFQPFQQSENKRNYAEGTGLGLAISQNLARQMNTKIEVCSEINIGSKFWFDLDLETSHQQPAPRLIDKHIIGYTGPRLCIQITDDVPDNRNLIREMLQPLGFNIIESENGQQALQQFQKFNPDLILMDVRMAVMDGLEATRLIRECQNRKQPRIIVITAVAYRENEEASRQAGCDDFIKKPVQRGELLQKIGQQLNIQWLFESSGETGLPDRLPEMAVPPPDVLKDLFSLAEYGAITDMYSKVGELKKSFPEFQQFTDEIEEKLGTFSINTILAFLEECIQKSTE